MKDEMWSHENSTLEYRQGYRDGLIAAMDTCQEYISALVQDKKLKEACWVEVALEDIENELSMYEVGDEG